MSRIYGVPGEEIGDQQVYKVLADLPNDFHIYAQPPLIHHDQRRDPDYVIVHKKAGVIVLEVKDWVNIPSVGSNYAMVQRRFSDEPEKETSPVEQARKAAFLLEDMLKEDEDLRNHAGKLEFPYRYAGFLPRITISYLQRIKKKWGNSCVFGQPDLDPSILAEKLLRISIPFDNKGEMTPKQVRAACAVIDQELKVMDPITHEFRGIYDETQEEIAKESLNQDNNNNVRNDRQQSELFSAVGMIDPDQRIKHLEREMPPDAADLKSNANIRLLRGFAGTGKTDVLVLRANYLHKQNNDIDILVNTFNKPIIEQRLQPELAHLDRVDVVNFDKLCAEIHRAKLGELSSAQNTEGILKKMAKTNPKIKKWGIDFLCDEFQWMKEIGRVRREDYINNVREGRGGVQGKTLSQEMKSEVFDIFQNYQKELSYIPAHDWVDRRNMTLEFLQGGITPEKKYDVILVDEAQHFAPNWMDILYYFLKSNGSMFICDDPSQSVYRFFSWRQKGVDVVGRTRWLRIPYRNTRQIFKAAFSLIADDRLARQLLSEDEAEKLETIDDYELRNGPKPKVFCFPDVSSEAEFIKSKIDMLMDEGVRPNEIGVLHTQSYVVKKFQRLLPREVNVFEARRRTGLEYPFVFIPQVQKLFDRDTDLSWDEDQSRQRMLMYMMMSRARTDLYLSYQQKWPKNFNAFKAYVTWCDE